ncbi:DNA replication and repair protein RecO [Sinobacterium caligoides]|uniref:DNA repair protein RecO n=1 Tax=Sinobacterium caligoides TaxID=933926 RepID=A0A3N2DY00_9GAMM|nr:DNA repair protein RecO [Sinobacterium caligoides]ROS04713.1 DNA replication and repair protein RecO [Sinobacterium caligoides]
MKTVDFDRCYLLHTYPFQDNSVIADFLSYEHGRQRAVIKNIRNTKKNPLRAIVQPLTLLQISWRGKTELKTVTSIESSGKRFMLRQQRLYSAIYLHEIIMRLVALGEESVALFEAYEHALYQLEGEGSLEFILRRFEFFLLQHLGYGIDWHHDVTAVALSEHSYYRLEYQRGYVPVPVATKDSYSGDHLLSIAYGDYGIQDRQLAAVAKRITRQLLGPYLGSEPLKSRSLFIRRAPLGSTS